MQTKQEVLQNCRVDGLVIKLPNVQLERKLYQEVAKALELIGGKWKGGKVFGFVFPSDPTELLEQIANGENRNLKKEFQFFATPFDLADELVKLANIEEGDSVLEPSAGQGAIIEAIQRTGVGCFITAIELMETNSMILTKKGIVNKNIDFLALEPTEKFHKIVANPPFSRNQDVDHIRHMYEFLNKGGRLVSIASCHWMSCNNKKETEFREWLSTVGAEVIEIEKGRFKESGTMVGGCIVVINK